MTRKDNISLKEFAKYPFLMREPGSGTRHAIEEHMRKYNIDLNLKMTIESNEAIKHAVMSGLGVSILSSYTLAFGGRSGLAEPWASRLPILLNWYLARIRNKRMSVIASTFLDYLNAQGRKKLLDSIAVGDRSRFS